MAEMGKKREKQDGQNAMELIVTRAGKVGLIDNIAPACYDLKFEGVLRMSYILCALTSDG